MVTGTVSGSLRMSGTAFSCLYSNFIFVCLKSVDIGGYEFCVTCVCLVFKATVFRLVLNWICTSICSLIYSRKIRGPVSWNLMSLHYFLLLRRLCYLSSYCTLFCLAHYSPPVFYYYIEQKQKKNTLSSFGACRRLIVHDESWKTSTNSSGCLDVCNDHELRIND